MNDMPLTPTLESKQPDIFSFGFDKTLTRSIGVSVLDQEDESSSQPMSGATVYDVIGGAVSPQVITQGDFYRPFRIVIPAQVINEGIRVFNAGGDILYLLNFQRTNAGTIFGVSRNRMAGILAETHTTFVMGSTGNIPVVFGTNDVERMRIVGNATQVGIGTSAPATSALLDLTSTVGALLLPRMTTTQRDALTATNGMQVYNTTTGTMQGYIGGAWTNM